MQTHAECPIAGQDPCWHAVYTRHQHERVVATVLSHKGFEVFHPTYRAVHRWKDRDRKVELTLFPGYVFLANGMDRRVEILSTPSVHMILMAGAVPAVIPHQEIDAIRRATSSSLSILPHPLLSEGDTVRVKSGPLTGVQGILQRKKDQFRLILAIEMLGRAAAVEIDIFSVERMQGPGVFLTDWNATRIPASCVS